MRVKNIEMYWMKVNTNMHIVTTCPNTLAPKTMLELEHHMYKLVQFEIGVSCAYLIVI